ncbi:MAG: AAA family ATPase [Desulfopila sp.]
MGQTVVVFFGMTASGKSHLSTAWARRHHCARFNTDVVRKRDIARPGEREDGGRGIHQGIYTAAYSRRTYRRLLELAAQALARSACHCVVLDGSYQLLTLRKQLIARFARRCQVYFIYCHCSEAVTRRRLAERRDDVTAVSDGDIEVYRYQCRQFEQPVEIDSRHLLVLDTDAPLEYLIDRLEAFLVGAGARLW